MIAKTTRASKSKRAKRSSSLKGRVPVQHRAHITVENILQAAEELFIQHEYRHVTTTRIAKRVGVSVGSLYQYFPDKKAIAYALVEATSSHAARALREEIYTDVNLPHSEAAHRAIRLVLRIYQKHEFVLLRLANEEPELRDWVLDLSLERLISSAAKLFIEQRGGAKTIANIDVVLFIIHNMIFESIRQFVLRKPATFTEDELIEEISSCLLAYYRTKSLDLQ
jgi:AcrR family transcriptional regulator